MYELIIKFPFKISVYIRSEDDQVHCFKPHGPIPDGLFELMVARSLIRQVAVAEEVDLEEDEENEYTGYISDESLDLDWSDELNAPNPKYHAF
uniref:Uncharacterized protein n=1 Tax=Ditylenchus dipsaci TaxID=166011 RepID=A0A915CU80_9BILA